MDGWIKRKGGWLIVVVECQQGISCTASLMLAEIELYNKNDNGF